MPFATFEGEGSVEEIADRLFVRLTPKQRETATVAILKANPRLERIGDVPRGVVIDVPDIPALRPKATKETQSPDKQMLALLDASLKSFGQRLMARHEEDEADIKAEVALAKSARFTKAVSRSDDFVALAGEARASLEARAKETTNRRKALETALGKAAADIEARTKRT
jgi:phage tail protein X